MKPVTVMDTHLHQMASIVLDTGCTTTCGGVVNKVESGNVMDSVTVLVGDTAFSPFSTPVRGKEMWHVEREKTEGSQDASCIGLVRNS